jgi:hypothetical protein
MSDIIKWFSHDHLPAPQQEVAQAIQDLAQQMEATLPETAEKTAGLRKLLEAKDCFVRASLELTQE